MSEILEKNTQQVLSENFTEIISAIGEDPAREGLQKTPLRAAQSFAYLTQGYQIDTQAIIQKALFKSDMSQIVIVKDIELYSLCEHHLLPFIGKCHVGYIPNGKILGLSKIARIVDAFARRLQVQERLTQQVAESLLSGVDAKGVAVVIEAKHLCMMMRGVEKQNSVMTTSVMLGRFRECHRSRAEFLALINNRE